MLLHENLIFTGDEDGIIKVRPRSPIALLQPSLSSFEVLQLGITVALLRVFSARYHY
jgi:hypothetical protein